MDLDAIKEILVEVYSKALEKADPRRLVAESMVFSDDRLYVDDGEYSFERVITAGFGKASCTMAQGVEDIIPLDYISGSVVTKYGHIQKLKKIKAFEAGHPIPDTSTIRASNFITRDVKGSGERDLVIFLISGGGSALLEAPRQGTNLKDIQQMTDLLLRSGATIGQINTLRKHVSGVKGGWLAQMAQPSHSISLIISDVIGSNLTSIASGPTVPDITTFEDCMNIIKKYGLQASMPINIAKILRKGVQGEIRDTPKPGEPFFERTRNKVLCDNRIFCRFVIEEAEKLNLNPVYITSNTTIGPVEEFVVFLKETIMEYAVKRRMNSIPPTLLVLGGEVTIRIPQGKKGRGGRNQHLALLFTRDCLPVYTDMVALFASTDGTDGPTVASGAFSHKGIFNKLDDASQGLNEAINEFNSYFFLDEIKENFVTGPTGNNLNDVFMILFP